MFKVFPWADVESQRINNKTVHWNISTWHAVNVCDLTWSQILVTWHDLHRVVTWLENWLWLDLQLPAIDLWLDLGLAISDLGLDLDLQKMTCLHCTSLMFSCFRCVFIMSLANFSYSLPSIDAHAKNTIFFFVEVMEWHKRCRKGVS